MKPTWGTNNIIRRIFSVDMLPYLFFFGIFAHSNIYIVCENYATLQLSPM